MKNLSRATFVSLAFVCLLLFIQCSDDGGESPPSPQITVFTTANTNICPGDTITCNITVANMPTGGFLALHPNSNGKLVGTTDNGGGKFIAKIRINDGLANGSSHPMTMRVNHNGGLSGHQVLSVKINCLPKQTISSYSGIKLGSETNPNNKFLAAGEGKTYNDADAPANSDKIDVTFFTAEMFQVIGAPGDTFFKKDYYPDVISKFSTANKTEFVLTTMSTNDFDALTEYSALDALTGFKPTQTSLEDPGPGDVIAFKTASGKKGLLKVTDFNGGFDGDITLDIKIQD